MENEKEVEMLAVETAKRIIYHREQSTLSKTQAEVIISEALLSHGKSCYERGMAQVPKNTMEYAKLAEANMACKDEEITRLKERVAELEKRAFEYHTEWESACYRERGRIEDVKDLEAKLKEAEAELILLKSFLNDSEGYKKLQVAERRVSGYEFRWKKMHERIEELQDRLANSWEKRTVESLSNLIDACRKNYGQREQSFEDYVASCLVKFLEQKQ